MAKAPGKNHRKGITFKQLLRKFPTDAKAEEWIVKQRWARGVCCPHCGSLNVQTGCQHKTMPFRCRERICAKRFSTKTGTVMEGSKIGYQDWIVAAFLVMTSLKSVSSMKLHRDLGITQKSAWFLAQRLRAALSEDSKLFSGPVEVDETYLGGKRKNMSNAKRKELADTGRGPVGKTAVEGARAGQRMAPVVVAEVLIPQRQPEQALVDSLQQQGATIGGHAAAVKASAHLTAALIGQIDCDTVMCAWGVSLASS